MGNRFRLFCHVRQVSTNTYSCYFTLAHLLTSTSALFTLYMPYLPIMSDLPIEEIQRNNELSTALAALRFACKMSTDISCQINPHIGEGPSALAVLAAPAGATCYLVILAFADLCRIFPAEAAECHEAIAEKFESLSLFSRRWGIAGKSPSQAPD
jgi:hypothetical protein